MKALIEQRALDRLWGGTRVRRIVPGQEMITVPLKEMQWLLSHVSLVRCDCADKETTP